MLAALSNQPALRALTTRDDSDPAIALADGWAAALDVLTFYQERIANENYLRTATELRSVVHLAQQIGYELSPGVSATTSLAFGLETSPGAPLSAVIPKGSKVQSIPGQDEKPQLFETSQELVARPAWNSISIRTRRESTVTQNAPSLYLEGLSNALQTGDALLLVGEEPSPSAPPKYWSFRRATTVLLVPNSERASESYTEVGLDKPLGAEWSNGDIAKLRVRVFALRQKASLFGHNAPDFRLLADSTKQQLEGSSSATQWPHFNITFSQSRPNSLDTLYLDNSYKSAVNGAWAVVTAELRGGTHHVELHQIIEANESARSDFGLSGKSTKIRFGPPYLNHHLWHSVRETTVFLQTDELVLVEPPNNNPVQSGEQKLDLNQLLSGDDLPATGRVVLIAGQDPVTGKTVVEQSTIKGSTAIQTSGGKAFTRLELVDQLQFSRSRDTVRVLANVAQATHGQTQSGEVLGSGNGSIPFQSFTLKRLPLTYVSSTNSEGRSTTLEVRVSGVLWAEVPDFLGLGPNDRVYVARRSDDGTTTVTFGDGKTGARLPTGTDNVVASYRFGLGLEGGVRAGQLSLLLSRPLGVREVSNPIPAVGAADPEHLDQARRNAPLTVLTLGRVVSLRDHEDFARAFPGIGKASAVLLWSGEQELVHLTVAAADGSAPPANSVLLRNLGEAIDRVRHSLRRVEIQPFIARPFFVVIRVAIDPLLESGSVIDSIIQALLNQFGFESRSFGQDVTDSQVLATVQGVPGVVHALLDQLGCTDGTPAIDGRLSAQVAQFTPNGIRSGELLTLAFKDIQLDAILP